MLEVIMASDSFIAFVAMHYDPHRNIDSVSFKKVKGVITEIYYDGWIYRVTA
jgi:hypothetical protein